MCLLFGDDVARGVQCSVHSGAGKASCSSLYRLCSETDTFTAGLRLPRGISIKWTDTGLWCFYPASATSTTNCSSRSSSCSHNVIVTAGIWWWTFGDDGLQLIKNVCIFNFFLYKDIFFSLYSEKEQDLKKIKTDKCRERV